MNRSLPCPHPLTMVNTNGQCACGARWSTLDRQRAESAVFIVHLYERVGS